MKFYHRYISLLLVLLSLSTLNAQEKKFNESFILITVTSVRGDSFYRVMTDRDEAPYLDIKNMMERFLDFTDVKCDLERMYCQGKMQPGGNVFWLDAKQSTYGDYNEGPAEEKIPEGAFVIKEGKCWLRYDVFAKWLPIIATWDVKSFYLSVIPEYKLKSERDKLRADEIEMASTAKKRKEIIDSIKPIKPDSVFRPEFKYHASVRKIPQQDVGADLNYDFNFDILRGTFQTGGPVTYDNRTVDAGRPYWVYKLNDQGWFKRLEVGDTYFEESDLLIPNMSAKNAFRFDTKDVIYGSGKINLNGRALPNTVVDVYRDGIYMGTTTAGSDSKFEFSNIIVNGKSRVIEKLYYPDGSEEIREVVLSEDNGMVLDKGQTEVRAFTGETFYGRMNFLALRYGLFDNFSIGVHPMFFAGAKNASGMADIAVRPFSDTAFLGQMMFTGKTIDRAFRVNTTLLYPNYIQFEHRFYNESTPDFMKNVRQVGEYWSARHTLGLGRLQFVDEYEQYATGRQVDIEIIMTLTRIFKPFFDYTILFPRDAASSRTIKLGLDVITSDHSLLEIYRTWVRPYSVNTISFIMRNILDVGGWDMTTTLNVPDRGAPNNFSADIMYRFTKNFSAGVLVRDKYLGFRINLDGIWTPEPGPQKWNDFQTGTMSGKIISPEVQGEQPYPIENAVVTAGFRSAVTDKDGNYLMSGIVPNDKIMVKVEPTSLDATMITEKEFDVVYFRPGTYINWIPKLVTTVGLDGVVMIREETPLGVTVDAVRVSDNKVVSSGVVENDGFFIIEKLTPGQYKLVLKGYSKGSSSVDVNIKGSDTWIRDVKMNIGSKRIPVKKSPLGAYNGTIKR
ncbi:MAG: hypothetical protein V1647_06605 [Pseudomonadota bacterium]